MDSTGFYTEFDTRSKKQVMIKCGISFVSIVGAKNNLETEIPDWDFDNIHQNARNLWNSALGKIKI